MLIFVSIENLLKIKTTGLRSFLKNDFFISDFKHSPLEVVIITVSEKTTYSSLREEYIYITQGLRDHFGNNLQIKYLDFNILNILLF